MIPKAVHRVWLGPYPQPAEYDYAQAWARTNPEWELCTWTDEIVHLAMPLIAQRAYDEAPTYVHRADILLPELVYRYGGVAVGYDMEPRRPLEQLFDDRHCWCTPDADGFAGGAFFGATPGHAAIRHVLETISGRVAREGWHTDAPNLDTGPWAWGEAFGRYAERCPGHGMAVLGDFKTAYPIRYFEKHMFDDPGAFAQRTAGSFVVHRFAGTWLNPELDLRVRRADVAS